MLAEGEARGFDLPLVRQALAVYDQAGEAGWGKRDGSSLPAFWSSRPAP
jgi:3-hydroxyisobutyrate dehydrogenase